ATSHKVKVEVSDGVNKIAQEFTVNVGDVAEESSTSKGTITLDASGSNGINFNTFIADYVKDLNTADYNFYGGVPDQFMGGTYYANGEQLALKYKKGSADAPSRIILEGDIAYDYIHNNIRDAHYFSGKIDGVTFGT